MKGVKDFLGNIPYAAELYWLLRQRDSATTVHMDLRKLAPILPDWIAQAKQARPTEKFGKKILVFGMTHNWISYTALLSLSLAAQGHDVTLAFMPYAHWSKEENRFDVRRQNAYIKETLKPAGDMIRLVSLYDRSRSITLPSARRTSHTARRTSHPARRPLETQAYRDTQYSLQSEEIEVNSDLYALRLDRDRAMAAAARTYLARHRPDIVIIPNGSIIEFAVMFQVARELEIPAITFEFGEQNYRMWLALNDDVMRQDTTDLWQARGSIPLTDEEWSRIRALFEARQGARTWQDFTRTWQTTPGKGAQEIKAELALDDRPLALLATNVLGDSLTLGRDRFVRMAEWIRGTIRWFQEHPAYQLVVRVHPGEQISWGPSVYDELKKVFPEFPENVRVLPADYQVNSYDLVELACVGLVYTTTLGMEMAMFGRPVIVIGDTHYAGKGFTLDPEDWETYIEMLAGCLDRPATFIPTEEIVNAAWRYAYRYFFDYPQPFPWHFQHLQKCIEEWPLERVLSSEGKAVFGETFDYLTGQKKMFGVES